MKKTLLSFTLLLAAMTAAAQQDFYWNYNDDTKTASVTYHERWHNHVWYDNGTPRTTSYYGGCHTYSGDIVIPETAPNGYTVTAIGSHAFDLCYITSVNLPATLTTIDERAFKECKRLKTVVIPEGVTYIGKGAFLECDSIVTLSLPQTLTLIDQNAFDGNKSVTSLTIPASVDSIGYAALMRMESLKTLTIADGPTALHFDNGVGYGGEGMFSFEHHPLLREAYIGRNTTTPWTGLFAYNPHIQRVTFGDQVTSIRHDEFRYSDSLQYVTFGKGLKEIGNWAFEDCDMLEAIDLPEGLTYVAEGVFMDCVGAKRLSLPSTLKLIDKDAFRNIGITELTIPASVDSIALGAFMDLPELTTLTVEDSPNTLHFDNGRGYGGEGMFAFNHQPKLQTIYMGRQWTTPSGGLFRNGDIKSVTLGDNVTTVYGGTFYGDDYLEQVTMGSGVNTVGDAAFYYNTALRQLNVAAVVPPVCEGNNTFAGVDKELCTLSVPRGSLQAYKAANKWKEFFNIEEMEDTKCARPTATLVDGRLHFDCETKGVTFHYEYSYPSGGKGTGNDITIGQTITLKLQATRSGLEDSEVAIYELTLGGGSAATSGDVNGDGVVDVADIATIISIMAKQ